jgi:hypothetical protein
MPVTPDDQEYSTTSRPKARVYVSPSGAPATPPASAAVRAAVPGSSSAIPTEKTSEPKPAGGFGKYLPIAIGAAVLFYLLRRK